MTALRIIAIHFTMETGSTLVLEHRANNSGQDRTAAGASDNITEEAAKCATCCRIGCCTTTTKQHTQNLATSHTTDDTAKQFR